MGIIIKSKSQTGGKKDIQVLKRKDPSVMDLKIGCTISVHEKLTLENSTKKLAINLDCYFFSSIDLKITQLYYNK